MVSSALTYGLSGIEGYPITVETDFRSAGMPTFEMVGLPDAAVKEARERVLSAIQNAHLAFPRGRLTLNLAPADVKKEGAHYDLPIALSLLAAAGQLPAEKLQGMAVMGELTLAGEVRPVAGVLPMLIAARRDGIKAALVPAGNVDEAACLQGLTVYGLTSLQQAVDFLRGKEPIAPTPARPYDPNASAAEGASELALVKGQYAAKRALEIAASGGHNLLLIGPPGSGKTMLARCLPGILPHMSFEEALQTTMIHSASGAVDGLLATRPFRAPHHTSSAVSLVGGGRSAMPGEISKAHNGVLFLDELPEFQRPVLEALRQPMEDGEVCVVRVGAQCRYPARFMLVCAMNPCPCGNYGSRNKACRCSPLEIKRYLSRVSGPLLDRIDLTVEVDAVDASDVFGSDSPQAKPQPGSETSATVRARVEQARAIAQERYKGTGIYANAQLTGAQMEKFCVLDGESARFMRRAMDTMKLSMRAYARTLKLARTLADMEGGNAITAAHIAEALSYRGANSKYWKE